MYLEVSPVYQNDTQPFLANLFLKKWKDDIEKIHKLKFKVT